MTGRPIKRTGQRAYGALLNGVPAKQRKELFAGLEAFANAGVTRADFDALGANWPTRMPELWLPKEHGAFLDYQQKLRELWRGEGSQEYLLSVLAYLLGLMDWDEAKATWFIDAKALDEFAAERKTRSRMLPVWGSSDVRFVPSTDFESALWLLSRESWRARLCGHCGRYFIAEKTAQSYCSQDCHESTKRSQRLEWWNRTGKFRRSQAKAVRSVRRSRNRRREK